MSIEFNTESPLLFLLERATGLVSGIKKTVALNYSQELHQIQLFQKIESEPTEIVEIDLKKNNEELLSFRKNQKVAAWFASSDLPFEIKNDKPSQRMMFDELSNVVLVVPFKSNFDGQNDFLFLYFNKDASNFGLRTSSAILSTETKTALAQIIQFSLYSQLELAMEYEKQIDGLKNAIVKLNHAYTSTKTTKSIENETQLSRIFDYAEEIAKNAGSKKDIHVQFSAESKILIEKWEGPISHLKNKILNAFEIAFLSKLNKKQNYVVLEDWHLDLNNESKKTITKDELQLSETKYIKTYLLLDKMEEAARKLSSKSMNLTGANLGGAMDNPISAAAITDAMKKHKVKINVLCKQFPDRWTLLRSEFKPFQNALILRDNNNSAISA